MPTPEKAQVIEQARDWVGKSVGMVFTDYQGLKVKEIQELRANLKAKNAEIHVIKNTLFRIAAGDDVVEKLPYEAHNGTTAVAFVYGAEGETAKVLTDFATKNKKLQIKGGYFGGKFFDTKGVEAISKLPSKDQLIAQVLGAIAAPLSNLVGVVEALYADPIRVIGAVADKVAEGSPLPAAEAKAEEPAAEQASSEETTPAAEEAAPTEPTEAPEATTEGEA